MLVCLPGFWQEILTSAEKSKGVNLVTPGETLEGTPSRAGGITESPGASEMNDRQSQEWLRAEGQRIGTDLQDAVWKIGIDGTGGGTGGGSSGYCEVETGGERGGGKVDDCDCIGKIGCERLL